MHIYNPTTILFIFTTIVVYAWIFGSLWVSLGSRAIVPLVLVTLWIVVQGLLASKGFYSNNMAIPPHFALVVVPPILCIIILSIFWPTRKVIIAIPILPLLLLHSCRLPVEIVLFGLYKAGLVPQLMTFEGGNLDILSGITAPIIALLWLQGYVGKRGLILWNFTTLALLLNIVIRAILSIQTPFQQLAIDHPNVALTQFPFILLPAFIVPVVFFCHVTVIMNLWMGRKSSKA